MEAATVPVPAVEDSPQYQHLGAQFVAKGILSRDQLDVALKQKERNGKRLGETLVELGFITEQMLTDALALASGSSAIVLANAVIDPAVAAMVPKEVASRNAIVPIGFEDGKLEVAMADVQDVVAFDAIRAVVPPHVQIIPLIAGESDIREAIDRAYGYEISIDGLLREIESGQYLDDTTQDKGNNTASPAVRLVNAILQDAVKRRASDIHFEPDNGFVRLRYRIDGILQQIRTFHKDYWAALCIRIKILSGMDIAETRKPQDGRIHFSIGLHEIDCRVATHPTIYGENIVVRILDKNKSILELSSLGYDSFSVNLIKRELQIPQGIFILTGPTGSGKTTTLYSILNFLNTIEKNIMTLEEPVEYQLPLARQTEVKEEHGVSFASGVRSILRQDPDIVLLGEIRDEETANMALRAAMTGHQVFSTLHTNDAISAIARLYDLGLEPGIMAGNLIGVVAQRLVRKLCPHCKRKRVATEEEKTILIRGGILPIDYQNKTIAVREAAGCDHCDGIGYRGRLSVSEILTFNDTLDDLIASRASRLRLKQAAVEGGFRDLATDVLLKVAKGETTFSEATKVVSLRHLLDS